jgi:multiple sugar transport system permease protein
MTTAHMIAEADATRNSQLPGSANPLVFPWLMAGPASLIMLAVMIYPLVNLILLSLRDYKGASVTDYVFVGTANYQTMLEDPRFWDALWRTLVYCGLSVLASMVLGTLMAFVLNRRFPGIAVLRTVFLLPMVAMPVASALVFEAMMNPNQGILNQMLAAAGLPAYTWLAHPDSALFSLVLLEVWMGAPFVMLIVLAGLQSMPQEPLEAARIDGATPFQTLVFVTLPMLRAALATAVLFKLIDTLKQFATIWVLTEGGPLRSTETLYVYGYALAFQFFDIGYGAAILTALLVLVLFVSLSWMRVRDRAWV